MNRGPNHREVTVAGAGLGNCERSVVCLAAALTADLVLPILF
ncbi:MAG TPA: hypothetical protein VHZ74_02455 [Bryobacteraceae bacterium]|jgi:hypothetical protein|nr:hypothetical protein [Bryobacteraceae bacterium]